MKKKRPRKKQKVQLHVSPNIETWCHHFFPTAGVQVAPAEAQQHCITFHSQLRSHLELRLTEVDPFGNHSSPHYKGTAIFYRATREQLRGGGGLQQLDVKTLGDPVCKLNLTLPKVSRPGPPLHPGLPFTRDLLSEESTDVFFRLLLRRCEASASPPQLGRVHARSEVGVATLLS